MACLSCTAESGNLLRLQKFVSSESEADLRLHVVRSTALNGSKEASSTNAARCTKGGYLYVSSKFLLSEKSLDNVSLAADYAGRT